MKRSWIVFLVVIVLLCVASVAWAVDFSLIFEQNPAAVWDKALARYQRRLESEIEILKARERATEPGSEPLRAALSGGNDGTSTVGLPVKQTGTVGDTGLRLAKEFTLRLVWFGRWLLHNIFAFYGALILLMLVMLRIAIGLIAILTPKKRIF